MARRFGFELEFSSNRIGESALSQHFRESIAENDPEQKLATFENMRTWTFKHDGSCGYEVTSPALHANPETFRTVQAIIRGVRRRVAGSRVIERNCGFHVHLDIHDLKDAQIKTLLKVLLSFEQCLYQLQPRSRHENSYCSPLRERLTREIIDSFDPSSERANFLYDHSRGVNFGHFIHRGTIEVRYGAGTINSTKIINWIRTLLCLIEISKHLENFEVSNTRSIDDFCDFINSNDTKIRWLENAKPIITQWIHNRNMQLHPPRQDAETR